MADDPQPLSEQVAILQDDIRDLKDRLRSEGLKAAEVNRHDSVITKVSALKHLKSQLDMDDPARDEALLASRREVEEQERVQKQKVAASQRDLLRTELEKAPRPLVQRKIFHLFRFTGSGGSFRYEPPARLNAEQTAFGDGPDPCPAVYVTEKWDGTTMQATSRHIFQRVDLWGKRKGGDPSQRYDLRLVAFRDEGFGNEWRGLDFVDADGRIAQALGPHLHALAGLETGLCVYFEVVHTDINTTFKHLSGFCGIRVFDFSRSASHVDESGVGGQFVPFGETITLSERHCLPIVGWEFCERLDPSEIWAKLAEGRLYSGADAYLEGFVVRESGVCATLGGRIAKARVEEVARGGADGSVTFTPGAAVGVSSAATPPASPSASQAIATLGHRSSYTPGISLEELRAIGVSRS